jgi:enterochelin esterase-like enzyme
MMMKIRFTLLLLACATTAFAQSADSALPGKPAPTNMRNAQYPRILPDNRVMFRIEAPQAQKVQIELGKVYDMKKDSQGVWTVTTDPVSGGFHYYSLLIDGVAVADPASETFYGMSRMASGIELPFAGRDYYALNDVPHGDIRMKRYYSRVAGAWKRFFIYTPPGYDTSKDSYPVLYIVHGGGEDERGWATQGLTDLILDNLIAARRALPMLVVMVDGNAGELSLEEAYLQQFDRELKQSIIPFVEAQYRVKAGAANRALAGLSLGGIQTLYTGVNSTDLFSYLGVFSSSWILPDQAAMAERQYAYMAANREQINRNLKQFWISQGGKEDIAYQNNQAMLARLKEMGIKYSYSESPGGHTWPVWRHDLYQFAPLLFR